MLTSKATDKLAKPLLYHYFKVEGEHCSEQAFKCLLQPGHTGHELIRDMVVVCTSKEPKSNEAYLNLAKRLLSILPPDRLKSIR